MTTVALGSVFGYYAFGDPDDTGCYVLNPDGPFSPFPPDHDPKDYTNVGRDFYIFFVMGFLLMLSQLVYTFFGVMFVVRQRHFYKKLAQISITITGISTIVWMIMGSVFRWRPQG